MRAYATDNVSNWNEHIVGEDEVAGWGVVIEFVNSGIGHTSSSEGDKGIQKCFIWLILNIGVLHL